jgi:hypothetical protein
MGAFVTLASTSKVEVLALFHFCVRDNRLQDFRGGETALPKSSNVTQLPIGTAVLTKQMHQPASLCFDVIHRDLVFVGDLQIGRWILNRVCDL